MKMDSSDIAETISMTVSFSLLALLVGFALLQARGCSEQANRTREHVGVACLKAGHTSNDCRTLIEKINP
jgi:hypothetical protein